LVDGGAKAHKLARDQDLLPLISELKSIHPFWGYRRIWANLRYINGIEVNQKRVARIMKLYGLGVEQKLYQARRKSFASKPRPACPNQWWGIDMTKVMTKSGWVYLVVVIDWFSKRLVGYEADYQSKTAHWLKALDMGLNTMFPAGVEGQELHLMSDNGSQPTSVAFMRACGVMGVSQAFTSYNNPKGNADTERFIRTMKEELFWLNEYGGLNDLKQQMDDWVTYYNHGYLHSSLNYKTPVQAQNMYYQKQKDTLLKAA
jgi:transposase InsO family protein